MANSKQLAQLIGPVICAMTVSEMINYHIWVTNIPPVTYLNGTLLFVAGISILRVHNLWVLSWQVLVTIAGWIGIFGGLFRMFFPEAKQGPDSIATHIVISSLLLIGIVLTVKGWAKANI